MIEAMLACWLSDQAFAGNVPEASWDSKQLLHVIFAVTVDAGGSLAVS